MGLRLWLFGSRGVGVGCFGLEVRENNVLASGPELVLILARTWSRSISYQLSGVKAWTKVPPHTLYET